MACIGGMGEAKLENAKNILPLKNMASKKHRLDKFSLLTDYA